MMELPDGALPPGFVPAGPPTPMGDTMYTGAGVPLPPSTVGSYHSRLPSQGVVIPPPSGKGGDESDDSSSDADTLTTPPRRYRAKSSGGYSGGGYSAVGSPYRGR